jgi:Mn-dependent DtxR family transcriptional regulator
VEFIKHVRALKGSDFLDEILGFHTVRGYSLLEQHRKLLTPAMEDYLEMIYRNSLIEGYMRVNALSDLLNVQPPSTTKMVQKLTRLGLLNYKKYGIIFLTDTGEELGKYLFIRHSIIETFLKNLGVNENLLTETELIEHSISATTLNKLELFNDYFKDHPDFEQSLQEYFLSQNKS